MIEEFNSERHGKPPFILREINHVPFSLDHHREVFVFMLKNGLLRQVEIHCLRISQDGFEKMITEYPHLIEAHLDFYSIENEYWLGRDQIEDDEVEIYLTLWDNAIQWFFIHLLSDPNN